MRWQGALYPTPNRVPDSNGAPEKEKKAEHSMEFCALIRYVENVQIRMLHEILDRSFGN